MSATARMLEPIQCTCLVIDRSARGLGVMSTKIVRAGQRCRLRVRSPDGVEEVFAEVRWWRREGAMTRLGLERVAR